MFRVKTMGHFPYLKILIVFSRVALIDLSTVDTSRPSTAVEADLKTDGGQFVRRIIHGEKISERPEYLLFTAPYRLCEGGCNISDKNNFVMAFPLHIGRKAKEAFKNVFPREYSKLLPKHPNAPFKKKTTRASTSPCYKINIDLHYKEVHLETTTTTIKPKELATTHSTRPPMVDGVTMEDEFRKPKCPQYLLAMCRKRKVKTASDNQP